MQNTLTTLLAFLLFTPPALAQQERLGKLVITKNRTYVVEGNKLLVDTLILHDNATLRFSAGQQNSLHVDYAIIGDKCAITAAGANGTKGRAGVPGEDGQDGADLNLNIHLAQLGSLTLDTRGGDGGDGYKGRNGSKPRKRVEKIRVPNGKGGFITQSIVKVIDGTPGEIGTALGAGGSGGNLSFHYSTAGFAPNFNREKAPHSIIVLFEAGRLGAIGQDGYSYENGESRRGLMHQAPNKVVQDGQLKIRNMSKDLPD